MLGGVADTHALVWFATNQPGKLGQNARRIFAAADRKDGSGIVTVPTAVLHEISCLLVANKVKLGSSFSDWVSTLDRHGYFPIIDVTADMVVASHSFQTIADPFDRLIMGCSTLLEQPLITTDEKITQSNLVQVVWD
jgi:PIN domain nuclease of toxin-antitoxin system